MVATWSLAHSATTIHFHAAVSCDIADSNALAHELSSLIVLFPIFTGTIFHVAFVPVDAVNHP